MSVLANAFLTEIRAAGTVDRNGDPAAGAITWSGRAAAYLKRVRRSVVSGGQEIQVKGDVLIVLDSTAAAIPAAGADWDASTITVEDRRATAPVTRKFTVRAAEHRQAGTIADSVRLELDRERP